MTAKAKLDYFYGTEAEHFTFFRVPKLLFTDARFQGISCEAKLLYGLMLDRMQLSIRKGWFDEQNRAYIQYSVEQVMTDLHCGNKKACKILKELDEEHGVGLIERVRVGLGQANVYYVKNFTTGEPQVPEVREAREKRKKTPFAQERPLLKEQQSRIDTEKPLKCQNDTSGDVESTYPKVSKGNDRKCPGETSGGVRMTPQNVSGQHANNKDPETDQREKVSVLPSVLDDAGGTCAAVLSTDGVKDSSPIMRSIAWDRGSIEQYFKTRFFFDDYMATLPHGRREMFAQYVDLVIDTVSESCDYVEIGQGKVLHEAVRTRFMELTVYDLLAVMDKVSGFTGGRIRNMHKYILTSLYREPVTRQSSIAQQVAYDLNIAPAYT